MRELNEWFSGQLERERRAVYLEEALLGARFWRYAAYRMRYFLARYAVAAAAHATTVALLTRTFDQGEFVAVLVTYAATGLVGSFWWGALEVLRGRVRLLYRSGKPHLIPREITGWLALSIWLAAAATAAAVLWAAVRLAGNGELTAADAYVCVLSLRMAAELVTRCYHSGIYAVRRVFRPLPAIVAVELVSLAGVLLLWPWLGGWAFPVAGALATAVATALAFRYTGRLYRFFGFAVSESLDLRKPWLPGRERLAELLAAGASSSLMSLDSLLLLAALSAGSDPLRSGTLLVLLFAVGPTIRAGSEWAQLLYFDLKRLEIRLFRNIRRAFDRHVLHLSGVIGLACWALACLIGTAVLGRGLGHLYWLLLLFLVCRSVLAALQMQAFSERAYRPLVANGALCAAGFVAAGLLASGREAALLAALTATVLAGAALLYGRRHALERSLRSREVLWFSEWLAELRSVRVPVRVASVRLCDPPGSVGPAEQAPLARRDRWRGGRLAERIAVRLSRPNGVTVFDDSLIAWFESAGRPSRVDREWLLTQSGGLADWLGETGAAADGAAALADACRNGLLGAELPTRVVSSKRAASSVEVRRAFLEAFPGGLVYDPQEPVPELLETLSRADRRLVMLDAVAFARDFRESGRRSRFDVTAYCVAGELRQIFLVERAGRRRARARWRSDVRRFNLEAALEPR